MAKKTSKKAVSAQVKGKLEVKSKIKEHLLTLGYKIVDCEETPIDSVTKFTLYARDEDSDVMIKIVSKPDKKSPFYEEVDEVLEEDKCTD